MTGGIRRPSPSPSLSLTHTRAGTHTRTPIRIHTHTHKSHKEEKNMNIQGEKAKRFPQTCVLLSLQARLQQSSEHFQSKRLHFQFKWAEVPPPTTPPPPPRLSFPGISRLEEPGTDLGAFTSLPCSPTAGALVSAVSLVAFRRTGRV